MGDYGSSFRHCDRYRGWDFSGFAGSLAWLRAPPGLLCRAARLQTPAPTMSHLNLAAQASVAWALGDSGLGLERDRTLANQIQELRGTSLPPTKQPSGISKSIWNQRGLQEIRVVNLD